MSFNLTKSRISETNRFLLCGWLLLCLLSSSTAWGQGYNLKAGPFRLNLSAVAGIEYNTNVNSSGLNPEEDIILEAGLDLAGSWEMTANNRIDLNLGLRYREYLENPELGTKNNFLTLTPGTQIAFEVYVGEITIAFRDRLDFSVDSSDVRVFDPDTGTLRTDLRGYARFYNEAEVEAIWQPNSNYTLNAGFRRTDLIPLESEFDATQRWENRFFAGVRRPLNSDLAVGLNGAIWEAGYDVAFQNDSSGWLIGASADWQWTELILVRGGIQWINREFETNGSNGDFSDFDGLAGSITLAHTLNARFNHSLGYSRSVDYGFVNNYSDLQSVAYNFTWDGFLKSRLTGGAFYQWGEDSGGQSPEDFERWGLDLSLGYQLTRKLSVRFRYAYTNKDSNLLSRDYDQHRLMLHLTYDF